MRDFFESGSRVRFLRRLTGQSRQYFADKYDLSPSTLRAWEIGKSISKKTALRAYRIFAAEGIFMDLNWLYSGQGDMPTLKKVSGDLEEVISYEEDVGIIQDLFEFKDKHKDSEDMMILQTGLEPLCSIGNYVAGVPVENINDNLINKLCIVKGVGGKKCVGVLSKLEEGVHILQNMKGELVHKVGSADQVFKVVFLRSKVE